MNRLILEPWELGADGTALINGARAAHLINICKITVGDTVRLGIVGGPVGSGTVLEQREKALQLQVEIGTTPPEVPKVVVYLALPRPQMLKRIFQKAATFGVQRLVLLRTERVEKSFFTSPLLREESIAEQLRTGLEQGGSTYLPEVTIYRRFEEFLEAESGCIEQAPLKLVFDINSTETLLSYRQQLRTSSQNLFVIGPEGGLIRPELTAFTDRGFLPVRLAANVLRVESAFDFALAQYSLLSLGDVSP